MTLDAAAFAAVREAPHLLVLSGAGISAESGIPTFRDDDGFWTRFPPEQFANWPALRQQLDADPARLATFLHHVIAPVAAARPNAAHRALAEHQSRAPVTVITQNIDGLHQAGGSRTVLEVHGSLLRLVDAAGQPEGDVSRQELATVAERLVGVRTRPGVLRAMFPLVRPRHALPVRPDVVLFGDPMAEPDWTLAQAAVEKADALLVVGTSAAVYPAAYVPEWFEALGRPIVTVGLERPQFGAWLEGRATERVPPLLADSRDGDANGR